LRAQCRAERGFTLVEVMVTLAVMAVVVAAALSVLFRAYGDTGIIENRRDVLGAGQTAMERMVKQIRQATSVNNYPDTGSGGGGDPREVDMWTFLGGSPHRVVWQVVGAAAPYSLEAQTDGGGFVTVIQSLASPDIFSYTEQDQALNQITITLSLGMDTNTVTITSDVQLRNGT